MLSTINPLSNSFDLILSQKFLSQKQTQAGKTYPNINKIFIPGVYSHKVKIQLNTILIALNYTQFGCGNYFQLGNNLGAAM